MRTDICEQKYTRVHARTNTCAHALTQIHRHGHRQTDIHTDRDADTGRHRDIDAGTATESLYARDQKGWDQTEKEQS